MGLLSCFSPIGGGVALNVSGSWTMMMQARALFGLNPLATAHAALCPSRISRLPQVKESSRTTELNHCGLCCSLSAFLLFSLRFQAQMLSLRTHAPLTMWKPSGFKLCILGLSYLALASAAEYQGNPANEIANLVNANRTATKLRKLLNNPGLGCMALQFISRCMGNCSSNNTLNCHPPVVDITEVYAPNCGVELPTVGIISGYLRGCHWNYLNPEKAFSDILIRDKKSVSLMHGRDLTEIGAGFIREKQGVFYWCILFSNDTSNSSFVLEEGGKGIEQKIGCFSGSDVPCSAGKKLLILGYLKIFVFILQLSFVVCY